MIRLVLLTAMTALFLFPATGVDADLLAEGSAPDIEAFMQIGFAGSGQIDSQGETLYFLSNASGVSQIYRREASTGWPYQLTVFSEGVDFYSLAPNGKHIVCGVSSGGDENAQLWLLNARSGSARALTNLPEYRHGQPTWRNDSKGIYYTSTETNGKDFHVFHLDLETGKKSLFADLAGWNSAGDISDDDRSLLVTHFDSNTNSDVYLYDTKRGRKTHLTPHDGESVYAGAQFNAAADKVYLISNANPDGLSRRAVIDIKTRKMTFLDTEGPWEVTSLGISPDRRTMAWTLNEDGYFRMRLWDLVQDRPLPAPPMDGQVSGLSFSRRSSVAFGFSSATSTADIWLWDWKAPEMVKLTHSTYAGVDPTNFVSPQLVRYESFDGLQVPAFLYLPPHYKKGEPVPFVVHVHGGPESQFRPSFIRHFQYLLLNGYGILATNVRGSSGYGKEYMDLDNYKKRLDSVKDLKAGADFLVREGYSAPGMLAVKGGSYGGYMTLAAITEYPKMFSAAVDQVGIANFVTFLENTAEYRRHLREAEYGPLSDREFLESVSPLNKAHLIETPLLVVHGENDPRVPVGEARQIAAAIEEKGGQVETLIFADEGHGVAKRSNALILYRKMVEFLDKQLKDSKRTGTE